MRYENGERIVFLGMHRIDWKPPLTIGKTYINIGVVDETNQYAVINDDNGMITHFLIEDSGYGYYEFCSLREYRRKKIFQLNI